MDGPLQNARSLAEKEAIIRKKGQFVEARDFYSFFTMAYLLNNQQVKLVYDYSGKLVSLETDHDEDYLSSQIETVLDED